eukprot:EG_transcript_3414
MEELADPHPNEFVYVKLSSEDCFLLYSGDLQCPTDLTMSNYRLCFSSCRPPVRLPLAFIESIEKTRASDNAPCLKVQTKSIFAFRVGFRNMAQLDAVLNVFQALMTPCVLEQVFAREYKHARAAEADDGWHIFDPQTELDRQLAELHRHHPELAGAKLFRLAALPATGGRSSYPPTIIVPACIEDRCLSDTLIFRSRGRLPSVSWVHPRTGAVVARCSQPMVGMRGQRSYADEKLCGAFLFPEYRRAALEAMKPIVKAESRAPPPSITIVPTSTPTVPTDSPHGKSPVAAKPEPLISPRKTEGSKNQPPRPPTLIDRWSSRKVPSLSTLSTTLSTSLSTAPRPPSPRIGPLLQFMDARSKLVASATSSTGGGYENTNNYPNAKITFMGLENIHHLNDSFSRLRKGIKKYNNAMVGWPGHKEGNAGFWGVWDSSDWLLHVQRIVWGGVRMAEALGAGDSIVTHCTDGWDRTSQLVTMAMLLLDPHYRTVRGFMQLIEREWVQMGHKFAERCGHMLQGETVDEADEPPAEGAAATTAAAAALRRRLPGPDIDDDDPQAAAQEASRAVATKVVARPSQGQQSPVFLQWLDAVFQLMRQLPGPFEFSPFMLEVLADQVYSCRYGTFLGNSEADRATEEIRSKTFSLWTDIQRAADREAALLQAGKLAALRLLNPFYSPTSATLRPSSNSKHLALWPYFLRYDLRADIAASADVAAVAVRRLAKAVAELRNSQRQVAMYRQLLREHNIPDSLANSDAGDPPAGTGHESPPPTAEDSEQPAPATDSRTDLAEEDNGVGPPSPPAV